MPVPPADPALPKQERGVRPARALPYELHADGQLEKDGKFSIDFHNSGDATGVLQVWSSDPKHEPRSYTVQPGKRLSDQWGTARAAVTMLRCTAERVLPALRRKGPGLEISARYDASGLKLSLEVRNAGSAQVNVSVKDRYASKGTSFKLRPGARHTLEHSLKRTHGWYDLTLTTAGGFEARYAGHVENGKESITDPGMGGLI